MSKTYRRGATYDIPTYTPDAKIIAKTISEIIQDYENVIDNFEMEEHPTLWNFIYDLAAFIGQVGAACNVGSSVTTYDDAKRLQQKLILRFSELRIEFHGKSNITNRKKSRV